MITCNTVSLFDKRLQFSSQFKDVYVSISRMFAMPFYAGYAVDITLLWSRRRNIELEVKCVMCYTITKEIGYHIMKKKKTKIELSLMIKVLIREINF